MNARNKPNGHAALLAEGSSAKGGAISLRGIARAASDDASGLSVANASALPAAAGAEREAYADVAETPDEGKRPQTAEAASRSSRGKKPKEGPTGSGATKASRR